MATLTNSYLTLADYYKRSESDGKIADVIEMLKVNNPMIEDMITVECNERTSHLTTLRTGLPDVVWRKLYQGVQPSKSTTKQVRDSVGMAEARSIVDVKMVDIIAQADRAKFLAMEGAPFIEALSQEVQKKLIYGTTVNSPEQFTGIIPRFNSLTAENGSQIVDAGGTGSDNTSILFVVWGQHTVHALYPSGSKAGISVDTKAEKQTITDSVGGRFDVYETVYRWDIGLSVRDWRYVVRIANIDVQALKGGSVDLYQYMRQAYYRLHQREAIGGKAAIYCNRDVLEALDALATNAGANDNFVRMTTKEVEGKEISMYRGIPVRQCDAILNTEARVV